MKPEERARVKIDKQLNNAGWEIVSRNEYVPNSTLVVKEAIMRGKRIRLLRLSKLKKKIIH